MGTLCRTGYLTDGSPEIKKELTVRPDVNNEFGFPPPPFKVFKTTKKEICVPRFYGNERIGVPEKDTRPEPARASISFKGVLRDETHQNTVHKKAVEAGHGVISLPCGYGKTTVALSIAASLGYRTMIIVHKEFLANQWRERIHEFCPGSSIGIVQQNKIEVENDFVIAMLQSLSTKEYTFSDFDNIGTVIVDEAHHICAKVFSQSLFKICPKHIYGLSATPNRKDGLTKILHWFMGPTIFSVERKNQEQVEVYPIDFQCREFNDPPPCNKLGKLSLVTMITMLIENFNRNKLIIDLIKKIRKEKREILVLSDRRMHCEYLHSNFTDSGLYMGGMSEQQLNESSEKSLIFGTFSQAHEGLDIPKLDTVILVTPKSDIKQSIGRILRETKGKKNNPKIYDIRDGWSILYAMYNKRLRVYKEGGFKINDNHKIEEEKNDFPNGVCLFK